MASRSAANRPHLAIQPNVLIASKLFFGLLGFSSIVAEVAVLVDRGTFNPANFFSYFTIQTNMLACMAFILGALLLAGKQHPRWFEAFRTAVAIYILIVGVGFTVLLSGLEGIEFTAAAWNNIVLHFIIPIAAALDFLLDRPKLATGFVDNIWWLLFPIAYTSYSLVRGMLTGWYPYPFLDPAKGYAGLALAVTGLTGFGLLLIWGTARLAYKPHTKA